MLTRLTARFRPLLLFVFCLVFVLGCKKSTSDNATPTPDLVASVSGKYTFQTITDVGTSGSQPTAVTNGTITIARNGTTTDMADLTLSYTAAGSSSGSQTLTETKTLFLKASGNNVDLTSGSSTVGTWTSTQLTLTGYPFNGTLVSLTATK